MAIQTRPLVSTDDLKIWWNRTDLLTLPDLHPFAAYRVGFASSERMVRQAQRLRYEVFNLELNEGLKASHATGLDVDQFDEQMTHLVLVEKATERIIGTYRLQTLDTALANKGIYCAQEFNLTPLEAFFGGATECGRACVALDHRKSGAILALWQGLRDWLRLFHQRWLFGCCSLTSTDPDDGWRALKTIRAKEYLWPGIMAPAQPGWSCGKARREFDPDIKAIKLPKLFSAYMRMGVRVVSEPAIDREFGTVDFLVMLDVTKLSMSSLQRDE